jgi:regulator of sirC expression with transglutaminase-like and TPR domain
MSVEPNSHESAGEASADVGLQPGQPAYCHPAAYRLFTRCVPDLTTSVNVFRGAWALSLHEHPDANLAAGETTLENLATAIRRRVRSEDPQARLAHLHDVLFEVFGLRGNTDNFYDPANSYLPEVLRHRCGIPITLSLIYCSVAEMVGVKAYGINAPGHFLVEVPADREGRESAMYVDPFYGGVILNQEEVAARLSEAIGQRVKPGPELLRRATGVDWLSRMLNNLQAVFAAAGRQRDVYAMQELQQLLTGPPSGDPTCRSGG